MTKGPRREAKPADGKSGDKYHYNPVGMAGKKAEAKENCPDPDDKKPEADGSHTKSDAKRS